MKKVRRRQRAVFVNVVSFSLLLFSWGSSVVGDRPMALLPFRCRVTM